MRNRKTEEPGPSKRFEVRTGYVIMRAVPRRGKPYTHRCSLESLKAAAHAAVEAGKDGYIGSELAEAEDIPSTQAAVAVAFMKAIGCSESEFKRNFVPAGAFEDVMVAYHYLEYSGELF